MNFNIKESLEKIKPLENNIILVSVIVLVAIIAFGLGRLSALSERKTPITIKQAGANAMSVTAVNVPAAEKIYVASKSGAKYHYVWCSGAERIKEENKVWFKTKEDAEKAGYTPASNCSGL